MEFSQEKSGGKKKRVLHSSPAPDQPFRGPRRIQLIPPPSRPSIGSPHCPYRATATRARASRRSDSRSIKQLTESISRVCEEPFVTKGRQSPPGQSRRSIPELRPSRAVPETIHSTPGTRHSTLSRGCLPRGTKQPDLRRRGWPPPRMACTTRPDPGTAGTRRIAAAAAAAYSAVHRSSSTRNAGDSGWTPSRGSHRPPSDGTRKKRRDESREGSTPPSCEGLDSPGPRLVHRGYPRFRRPRRFRMASRPSPAPARPPVAANLRSVT